MGAGFYPTLKDKTLTDNEFQKKNTMILITANKT